MLDLRNIRSPIILFASMGDNITPTQQAFNWVADVYGSTDEIKARGQVIIGLLHQSVGHLGIFVSGAVAKKEHAQIVSVLKSVEALPPGLYGMQITETQDKDGKPLYDVHFIERALEEVVARTNRANRVDEKPFQAVEEVSDFNQRAYELFAQPLVRAMSNDFTAKLSRELHPLRMQRWGLSDLNPWLGWLRYAAPLAREQRQPLAADSQARRMEGLMSEIVSASLDYYREMRDATSEAQFFQLYGNMFALYLADKHEAETSAAPAAEGRELPFVKDALAAIAEGGYPEALSRVAALLARRGEPLPLAKIALKAELAQDYKDLLPALAPDEWRRVRGEQEIVVRYERERAIETLPMLLADAGDRERFFAFIERLFRDERLQHVAPNAEQKATLARLRDLLHFDPPKRRLAPLKKA